MTPGTAVSDTSAITLNDSTGKGAIVGGTAAENAMSTAGNNSFTMDGNNSYIKAGTGINVRQGSVNLNHGTVNSNGVVMTDRGHTDWNITNGTTGSLTISGDLQLIGTGSNTFEIYGTTKFDGSITGSNSGNNEINFNSAVASAHDAANFGGKVDLKDTTGDQTVNVKGGAVLAGSTITGSTENTTGVKNTFNISGGTMSGAITGATYADTYLNVTDGLVNGTFTGGQNATNVVNKTFVSISGGEITGTISGSALGANYFHTTGGLSTGWLLGNSSTAGSDVWLDGGIIKNVSGSNAPTLGAYVRGSVLNVSGDHSSGAPTSEGIVTTGTYGPPPSAGTDHVQAGDNGAHAYRVINIEELHVGRTGATDPNPLGPHQPVTGAVLEIGFYNGSITTAFSGHAEAAQLSAKKVTVYSGNKLVVNADASGNNFKHYTETVDISGTLTINETTLQSNGGTASFNIRNGGVLHGFGKYTSATDHTATTANTIGKLLLDSGSTLKPYDYDMFGVAGLNPNRVESHDTDADLSELKGVNYLHDGTLEIKSAIKDASSEAIATKAATIATRLFDNTTVDPLDGSYANVEGQADWITVTDTVDLSDVRDKVASAIGRGLSVRDVNNYKVQYDPIFGFSNELVSKQQFKVTRETDNPLDKNIYEFLVIDNSASATKIQQAGEDANSFFNQDILKSDMLGSWSFEYRNSATGEVVESGGDQVWLKYIMTSEHPTNGGFFVDAITPNSREIASILDTWRYPFQTDYNSQWHHLLETDPATGINHSLGDDNHNNDFLADYGKGYSGDMNEYYASQPGRFDNYQDYWINDFSDLLRGMQHTAVNSAELEKTLRQLHAESYASIPNVNMRVMNTFINLRERNTMSALYQVEDDLVRNATRQAAGEDCAGAPGYEARSLYVVNPVRFWASAFGMYGDQKNASTEYGFKSRQWGGSVGMIKEYGDTYLGATLGVSDQVTKFDELSARSNTQAYLAELLVGRRFGMGFAEIHGNYGYYDQTMRRNIDVTAVASNGDVYDYKLGTSTDYADNVFGGGIRFGYQKLFGGDKWLFVPTVGLSYLKSENRKGFEESGRHDGSVRLRFAKGVIDREVFRVPVTMRLTRPFAVRDYVVAPEIRAGYTQLFGDKNGVARAEFVGFPIKGAYFKSRGVKESNWEAQLGTTVELSRRGRFYAAVNYDFTMQEKSYFHNFSIQAGLNF